jgi:hypothetical protein
MNEQGSFMNLDYREIFKLELEKRRKLSPKYSLCDFAKDIGLLPSHLSYVLRKQRGLSRESAGHIAKEKRAIINLARIKTKNREGLMEYKNGSSTWFDQSKIFFQPRGKSQVDLDRFINRMRACGLD